MSISPRIALSTRTDFGSLVDSDARCAGRLVPAICVSKVLAFVLVVEGFAQSVIDAPGDEGGALALVEVPGIDAAAGAGCTVGVIVCAGLEVGSGGEVGVEVVREGGGDGCREGEEGEELHFDGCFDGYLVVICGFILDESNLIFICLLGDFLLSEPSSRGLSASRTTSSGLIFHVVGVYYRNSYNVNRTPRMNTVVSRIW